MLIRSVGVALAADIPAKRTGTLIRTGGLLHQLHQELRRLDFHFRLHGGE
ncbi:MAG: hypothetical protein FWH14_02875 [Oscillospiraceae bacterium]|nr:hypothetical protein [Oscillospiraceae bacterium]